jgi:6-pyruvoyltetrahydropterin/6-carboxytetrahydropterin synthase
MTTLTKRYRFAASHRLHVPSLSDEENTVLFGKCNNPFGHGHDYTLSVTVSGEPARETGLILPLARLDEFISQHILGLFDHRNLNVDVAALAGIVPTTENVALVIADLLEDAWPKFFADVPEASLSRVHVQETARNGFEVDLKSRKVGPTEVSRQEIVTIHA